MLSQSLALSLSLYRDFACAIVINRKFPTNCCFRPNTVRAYVDIKATAVKYALIYPLYTPLKQQAVR